MTQDIEIVVETTTGRQTLRLSPPQCTQRLTDTLRRAGFALNTRCSQRGLCDGCVVHLMEGEVANINPPHRVIGSDGAPLIRACEHLPASAVLRLRIPPRSMLAYEPQVVSDFKLNIPRAHEPLWQTIELPQCPTTPDELASAAQLHLQAANPPTVTPPAADALAQLTGVCPVYAIIEHRPGGWQIESLRTTRPLPPIGVAIDIGTTTVALMLVDLATGAILHTASGFNRQMHMGDDVLTRINLCTVNHDALARLQGAIVKDTIEQLLIKAMTATGVCDNRIVCFTIAANTTMLHLYAGVDPSPMGFAPFVAPFLDYRVLKASDSHLRLTSLEEDALVRDESPANAPDPAVHLLPSVSAYVGADLAAGVMSSGLAYDDGPSLLVDVGTNGEIIFRQGHRMWGTATAAGPAFEGSRMPCGMRAGQGAISHIRMSRDLATGRLQVDCDVIGNVKPTGLCGSAFVDFLAQGRKVGLLSSTGRYQRGVADDRFGPYRDMGTGFTVAHGHGNEPIVICESDVASLLQAKAAVAAGILTLLRQVNITPQSIKTLYLAGGFGMHLDIPNTIACGLLPGFTSQQVQLVGNTSLAGAYLSLLDSGILAEIRRVARQIQIVELNLDPEFETTYIDQLQLE